MKLEIVKNALVTVLHEHFKKDGKASQKYDVFTIFHSYI